MSETKKEIQIELRCSECETRFRIRVRRDVVIPSLPCPTCKTPVAVPLEGVEARDARSMFGRKPAAVTVERELPEDDDEPIADARFKDVTKVGVDREQLSRKVDLKKSAPVVASRPPVPEDRPRLNLPKSQLRAKLKEKLAEESSSVVDVPPLPQTSSAVDVPPLPQTSSAVDVPPLPQTSSATSPPQAEGGESGPPRPPIKFTENDLEQGVVVRVEGTEYGTLEPSKLETIVASGVWPGAMEVKTKNGWVSLDQHPALMMIRKRLATKAKVAVSQISQEFEREAFQPAVDAGENQQGELQSRSRFGPVAVAIVMALGIVGVFAWQQWASDPQPVAPVPEAPIVPPPEAREFAKQFAFTAATVATENATMRDRDPSQLMAEAEASLARANFGDALDALFELRRRNPKEKSVLSMLATAQLGAGRYRDARRTVVTLAALNPDDEDVAELFRDAVQNDDALGWDVLDVAEDVEIDQIKALGGGKSVSFKFKREGREVYAFKPSQNEWEEGWRGEIAAYRFCELANCGFTVPRSRPVRLRRTTLESLYPMNTDWQQGYAERFEEIAWTTEVIDNELVDVTYGVMKDWIPSFADWPIEYTEIWIDWLNPTVDATGDYDKRLSDAMESVEEKNRESWRKLRQEFADTSVRQAAKEISNLLVFDFLINNWDRFSDREEYYGVNNQFADGHFVSLDNGAGFGLRHSSRVEERFDLAGRYSREMLASIRLIDPSFRGVLMPNPSETEKKRMALFFERRQQFLERVKKNIAKHNEEKVLAFD